MPVSTGAPSHSDASARVATGPTMTSSPSKSSSQSGQRPRAKDLGELGGQRFLVLLVVTVDEVGPFDQLAEPLPELRLDGSDGEEAAVGGLVRAVAREPAGERALRLAVQPVRCESVRVVRHRDDEVRTASRALAFEQRGQDLDDGEERAACEIGDLHRR